jgi:hypothetical protein
MENDKPVKQLVVAEDGVGNICPSFAVDRRRIKQRIKLEYDISVSKVSQVPGWA